jgi:hypothetical protein
MQRTREVYLTFDGCRKIYTSFLTCFFFQWSNLTTRCNLRGYQLRRSIVHWGWRGEVGQKSVLVVDQSGAAYNHMYWITSLGLTHELITTSIAKLLTYLFSSMVVPEMIHRVLWPPQETHELSFLSNWSQWEGVHSTGYRMTQRIKPHVLFVSSANKREKYSFMLLRPTDPIIRRPSLSLDVVAVFHAPSPE